MINKQNLNKMENYLTNLITEKGLGFNKMIEVKGDSGMNFIPLGVVLEHIMIASKEEQKQIKNTLIKIDFHNGDIMHFFTYLAKAIAK